MACVRTLVLQRCTCATRLCVTSYLSKQRVPNTGCTRLRSWIPSPMLRHFISSVCHGNSCVVIRQSDRASLSWSKQKWSRYLFPQLGGARFFSGQKCRHLCLHKTESLPNSTVEDVDPDHTSQENTTKEQHVPVMVNEVLQALQPSDGQVIVDMTFGAGGHAKEILSSSSSIKYIGSDRDPLARRLANRLAAQHRASGNELIPVLGRFSELPTHLSHLGITPGSVDGFLFDLGASSMQFDHAVRGFSISKDGPLDMRMDGHRFPESPTAADVVNTLDPSDLAHILKKYGEESRAREIAHALVEARYAFGNFTRTEQLARVVKSVFNSKAFRHDKLYRQAHVATKTFQALRIFVNNELNELHNGLEVARHFLKPGGRCVVISFHSLEDRIVKRHFHGIDVDQAANLTIHDHFRNANVSFDVDTIKQDYMSRPWRPLSRKVTEPLDEECYRNPRARSAKLRAAVKENYIVAEEQIK